MDAMTWCRTLLIYVHLLLAVFALRAVLHTDLQVLRQRLRPVDLERVHRQLLWMLGALWVTGLAVAAIDLDFDIRSLPSMPKLLAKITCVGVLTLNGLLLRHWCFPRLADGRRLGAAEHSTLMVIGAISSASWLMAAFIGVARPLQQWQTWQCLALYGAALCAASLVALFAGAALRQRIPTTKAAAAMASPARELPLTRATVAPSGPHPW